MPNSNKANILFLLLLFAVIFTACGTDTSSKNTIGTVEHHENDLNMHFTAPSYLANAAISSYLLQAEATIDGDNQYDLNVDSDRREISGKIPDISVGTYTLQVTYYYIYTSEKVILCTFSKNVSVSSGESENVIIGDSDLNRNYDNDNDGYTNLVEYNNGTNPLDPNSPPINTPINVIATAGNKKVTLNWDSVVNATSYKVYRNIAPGISKFNYIDDISTSSMPYTWTGFENGAPLVNGTKYYFVVTAVNDNGDESIDSAEVNATPKVDCQDADNDNYGVGSDCLGPDCDDTNELINPGSTEICDNIDNDCNGQTDENLTRATTCGVGECAGNTGTETCTSGIWGDDTCDPTDGSSTEICDGLDNDCDGVLDGSENLPRTCGSTNTGECTIGIEYCNNTGNWVGCNAVYPASEICTDFKDNDCDGYTDVADTDCICTPGETRYCNTGTPGVCADGIETCTQDGESWGLCVQNVMPSTEGPYIDTTCSDGEDNDCDGQTDDQDNDDCTLIAYYPFTGDTNDVSGNSYHGTVYGAIFASDRFGSPSSAFYFDGQSDYIVTDDIYIRYKNKMSVILWVKPDADASTLISHDLISKHSNPGDVEILLKQEKDLKYDLEWTIGNQYYDLSCAVTNSPNCEYEGLIEPTYTSFDFLAAVYDGTQIKLFVNGSLIKSASASGNIADNSWSLTIGATAHDPSKGNFKGVLDEITIYNRVLSASEILTLYQNP